MEAFYSIMLCAKRAMRSISTTLCPQRTCAALFKPLQQKLRARGRHGVGADAIVVEEARLALGDVEVVRTGRVGAAFDDVEDVRQQLGHTHLLRARVRVRVRVRGRARVRVRVRVGSGFGTHRHG